MSDLRDYDSVANALAFFAPRLALPDPCVSHPPGGLTTAALGGKVLINVPRTRARGTVVTIRLAASLSTRIAANTRRLGILWFKPVQQPSWLASVVWQPTVVLDGWHRLEKKAQH